MIRVEGFLQKIPVPLVQIFAPVLSILQKPGALHQRTTLLAKVMSGLPLLSLSEEQLALLTTGFTAALCVVL
jgi:hypothetical protein